MYTVVAISPKTKKEEVVWECKNVNSIQVIFDELTANDRNQRDVILVMQHSQYQFAPLQSRVIGCNLPELTGKLFFYAKEYIEENGEELMKKLASESDFGINAQELNVFQKLKDQFAANNLIMAKTSLFGIPTLAICEQLIEGEDIRMNPLAIVVTPNIFKQLSAPDDIKALF